MSTNKPVDKNDPLMTAWEAFKGTEEFTNACKWALTEEHLHGSLWAVFLAGYQAGNQPRADLLQKLADHETLFNAVMKDIHQEAEGALGNVEICSAPQAVRRLAQEYQRLRQSSGEHIGGLTGDDMDALRAAIDSPDHVGY